VRMRDATLEDLPSIVEIYNSIIPGRKVSADTEPVSVEQRLPWFYEHDPARRPIRLAEEEPDCQSMPCITLRWCIHCSEIRVRQDSYSRLYEP
jgi:L-amino acid N-acyltransferase YncA